MSQAGIVNTAEVVVPGSVVETLTPNSGGPVSAVANNINDQGLAANPGGNAYPVFSYNGGAGQLNWENRTYLTPYVVDHSTTDGSKGTFTTIQAAITQAVADGYQGTIFIRAGTYNENLTLAEGIHLEGFTSDYQFTDNTVTIEGTHTFSAVNGFLSISFINFFALSGTIFTVSSGASIVFSNCGFSIEVSAVGFSGTGGVTFYFYACQAFLVSSAELFSITSSSVQIVNSYFSGVSSTASTFATSGSLIIFNSILQSALTFTGALTSLTAYNSSFGAISNPSATLLTYNSTNASAGASYAYNCSFESAGFSAISIGAGATLRLENCIVNSSNTNAITGAGTLNYGPISFAGTSSTINTTTQNPLAFGPIIALPAGPQFMAGAGSPNGSITAPQGSLYLRTDGSSDVTRAYINTNGGTTWTAVNTVA